LFPAQTQPGTGRRGHGGNPAAIKPGSSACDPGDDGC
jgi:hypothetical protein